MRAGAAIAKAPPIALRIGAAALPFPFCEANTHLTRSGRFAIREGLRALGLEAGSRVLMPAWHCGSELDAVLAAGLEPVLYRLRPDLSADLEHLEQLLAQSGGTAAVYVIHYFGYPQPLPEIRALAAAQGARVVEDLALGLFSRTPEGCSLGRGGDMAVFSLVKTLPLPDGGALWLRTARPGALERLHAPPLRASLAGLKGLLRRSLRGRHGPDTPLPAEAELDRWQPQAGIRPADMGGRISTAARFLLGTASAERTRQLHRRNYLALQEGVPRAKGLRPLMPDLPEGACPAFFPLYAPDAARLHAALRAAGIESVRFWRQFHPAADLGPHPGIAQLKRSVLRLPVHGGITPQDSARICRVLRQAVLGL